MLRSDGIALKVGVGSAQGEFAPNIDFGTGEFSWKFSVEKCQRVGVATLTKKNFCFEGAKAPSPFRLLLTQPGDGSVGVRQRAREIPQLHFFAGTIVGLFKGRSARPATGKR